MSGTGQPIDPPPISINRGRTKARQRRRSAVLTPHLPIDCYEFLTVAEIVAHFSRLSPTAVEIIRDHEQLHRQRRTLLAAAERVLHRSDGSRAFPVDDSDGSHAIDG